MDADFRPIHPRESACIGGFIPLSIIRNAERSVVLRHKSFAKWHGFLSWERTLPAPSVLECPSLARRMRALPGTTSAFSGDMRKN